MISRVHSSILQGIDAIACEVEADVSAGSTGELALDGRVRPIRGALATVMLAAAREARKTKRHAESD